MLHPEIYFTNNIYWENSLQTAACNINDQVPRNPFKYGKIGVLYGTFKSFNRTKTNSTRQQVHHLFAQSNQ